MANKYDKLKKKHDPVQDLSRAKEVLSEFASRYEEESIPHVDINEIEEVEPEKKPSFFKKVSKLLGFFVHAYFSDRFREEQLQQTQKIQTDIFRQIDFIKSLAPLLESYQNSKDETKKKLATDTLKAVDRFNAVLTKWRQEPPTLTNRIARYFYEQSGLLFGDELIQHTIELPKKEFAHHIITSAYKGKESKKERTWVARTEAPLSSKRVALFAETLVSHEGIANPSSRELEAFHMKAVALIRGQGLSMETIKEALHVIKLSPVEATLRLKEEQEGKAVVSIRQVVSLLPGEQLELTGSFYRATPNSTQSIPIPESFRLSSRSKQTGHPHPSQHTGWALPHGLLPAFPLRPEQLDLLQGLYRKKNDVAIALLPKGSLNQKARQLLKWKRTAFEVHSEDLVAHHFKLILAIISAAEVENMILINESAGRFFEFAQEHEKVFDYIVETYQTFNELMIEQPSDRLRELCPYLRREPVEQREQHPQKLLDDEMNHALTILEAKKIEHKGDSDRIAIDFMLSLAEVLKQPVQNILLQQYSEYGFKPRMLNNFEQKLQACVHRHLICFLNELNREWPQEEEEALKLVRRKMIKSLDAEIELFESPTIDTFEEPYPDIVNELESYYNARFYERT